MRQPFNPFTNQPFNPLTIHRFNDSVIQSITRVITALLIIPFIGLVLPDDALARLSISQMTQKYGVSILEINSFNQQGEFIGSGSGFFIDRQGTLVTSYHVLEGCHRASIKTWTGEKGEIRRILRDDPERDLLIAETSFQKTIPLPFRPSAEIRINDDVICFGQTEETPCTITMGRVTDVIPVHDFRVIKISAPILPGISGAPVLNQDGELIAIAAAYLDIRRGLFFAIPSDNLTHLRRVNLPLKALPVRKAGLGATVQGNRVLEVGIYPFQQMSLTVHFKDGRQKCCDRVWIEGDTVYLVMQGKKFVVGYPKDEIDMQKSFGY
jgi:S1-C subfamily serine protease